MNAALQKSLDAIELSLAALLESITADAPSAEAASALIKADDDLSSNLEQLVTHQTYHQRLLHLRALSSALDSELSSLLTTLSQARTELLSKPTTIFPSHSRQVEYDALLSYATKISKFTRPPTHLATQTSSTTAVVRFEANGDVAENGINTTSGENTTNAATQPTAEDIAMLDPTANMPFAPWPSEEVMKRGILANMGFTEGPPNTTTGEQGGEGTQASIAAVENTAQLTTDRKMTDADKERAREEAAKKEAERKAKEKEVFQGLFDLYDPDSE